LLSSMILLVSMDMMCLVDARPAESESTGMNRADAPPGPPFADGMLRKELLRCLKSGEIVTAAPRECDRHDA